MKTHAPGSARARPSLPAFKPVPRKHQRHDGWTPERQRDFIAALADTGSVRAAADRVGMASEGAYALRRATGAEEFSRAWALALDHAIRLLEDAVTDRAIHGVDVPVYSYGKLVGTRRVFNDRLAMFLLRTRLPDRYTPYASAKKPPVDPRPSPETPDNIATLRSAMAEVRARRADEESDPRGRLTISGDDREAFERWKGERDAALSPPSQEQPQDGARPEFPGPRIG